MTNQETKEKAPETTETIPPNQEANGQSEDPGFTLTDDLGKVTDRAKKRHEDPKPKKKRGRPPKAAGVQVEPCPGCGQKFKSVAGRKSHMSKNICGKVPQEIPNVFSTETSEMITLAVLALAGQHWKRQTGRDMLFPGHDPVSGQPLMKDPKTGRLISFPERLAIGHRYLLNKYLGPYGETLGDLAPLVVCYAELAYVNTVGHPQGIPQFGGSEDTAPDADNPSAQGRRQNEAGPTSNPL